MNNQFSKLIERGFKYMMESLPETYPKIRWTDMSTRTRKKSVVSPDETVMIADRKRMLNASHCYNNLHYYSH